MMRLRGLVAPAQCRAAAAAASSSCLATPVAAAAVRTITTHAPLLAVKSSGGGGGKGDKTTTTTVFGQTPRLSSAAFAGPLSPSAPEALGVTSGISAPTRAALLNPTRVSRGHSHRSAVQHRELHEANPSRFNHSFAYYVQRSANWAELVDLAFEFMHRINLHNYVRVMQKLVKLSPTRQLLDAEGYNRFGRFIVSVEHKLHEMDTAGMLREAFMPYHYLRQCLKQMHLAQEKARELRVANPLASGAMRRGLREEAEAAREADHETAMLARTIDDQQAAQEAKYAFGRRDEKTKKLRAREQRAGRAFVSVAQTKRDADERRAADRAAPSFGKKR